MRILFIDDNDDLRSLMPLVLTRQGYEVETANCAESALLLCPLWKPQIVISDIGMPGRDGYEMIHLLRANRDLAPFRAIALTGFSLLSDKKRALHAGFDECLSKPVNFSHLFDVIQSLGASLASDFIAREQTEINGIADFDSDLTRFSSR